MASAKMVLCHLGILSALISLSVAIPNCVNTASSTTCDILNYHKPEWVEYCCYNMNVKQCCFLGGRPCLESCPYNNNNDPWCCNKYKLCCPKKPTTKKPKAG